MGALFVSARRQVSALWRLVAEPIRGGRQLLIAFLFMDLLPTVVVLAIDVLDGGVGEPLSWGRVACEMSRTTWHGFREELICRASVVVCYFAGLRLLRRSALGLLKFLLVLLLLTFAGLWVASHFGPGQNNPLFQLIQLIPCGILYINLWRGVASVSSVKQLGRRSWLVVAALGVHPFANVLSVVLWQLARLARV